MKRFIKMISAGVILSLILSFTSFGENVQAFSDSDIYMAQKLIYETTQVTLKDIPVVDTNGNKIKDAVSFTLYDTSTQEFAGTLTVKNGVISPKKIIKGHHYMLWLNESSKWCIEEKYHRGTSSRRYFTLNQDVSAAAGIYPVDDKQEQIMDRITLVSGKTGKENNRVNLALGQYGSYYPAILAFDPQYGIKVSLADDLGGAKVRFTSQYDTVDSTVYANDPDGSSIQAKVYEDVDYSVSLVGGNGRYKVLSTLITNKDHSEQYWPIYTYTHYTCSQVSMLYVTDDMELYNKCKYPAFTSQSKKTTVEGIVALIAGTTNAGKEINQGSNGTELIFREQYINDTSIKDDVLEGRSIGKDYTIVDIDAINLHRNEICKMPSGDYTITTDSLVPTGKLVDKVYTVKTKLNANKEEVFDKLEECKVLSSKNGKVSFKSSSVSLYNNIITYKYQDVKKDENIKPSTDKKTSYKVTNTSAKKATVTYTKTTSTANKIVIPETVKDKNFKSYNVTEVAKNALKGNKKVTTLSVGKNVIKIGEGAFQNATKLSSVKLEGKVTNLGKNAFYGDKRLKSITLNGNGLKSVGKNAFKGIKKNCKITIQAKNKAQYNKVVKLIQKSGAKNVKYVYKKKKA